ncbi:uncharacterized protein RCC_10010 [Ramularia collo-cygni]|uniref:Uncharacterized protein n=1 Tax=Ramularia collo-cygni TaxID=112498 RepID=A0A2D3VL67_9PEZI|nr:uncharacterized protein RCC_10010 [Ramularia collo-cygni]CZT24289.1 uncharacterized protein RCC_10010 [Ramularia collo-cygni]
MCKTQSIAHICGHTVTFRLSICAASFQFQTPKSEVKAKCCASPDITLHFLHPCGPCERIRAQERVTAELALIEAKFPSSSWAVPSELEAARAQADHELWADFRKFPDSKFKSKRLSKPERGWKTATDPKGSLLRTEVKPGDVLDEWGGAISLSDEIASIEAERAADGMPPLAPLTSVFEDDNDWGNIAELGVCEPAIPTSREYVSTRPAAMGKSEGQDNKTKSDLYATFQPPHLRHRRRLQERAQQVLHDTSSINGKKVASEATNMIRRLATPFM